jgi:predicted permease
VRFYRALLRLCPASFRDEYGREMTADVLARRQRTTGLMGVALFWIGVVADLAVTAVRVHVDIVGQDLRHARRSLGRAPGFAITVVLISGLGIDAATTAFSVADHVLIRRLPFPSSDQLVDLWQSPRTGRRATNELSPANYRDWKRRGTVFQAVAAYRGLSINVTEDGHPEQLSGAAVTADLFPLLGARPQLGRVLESSDDREGAAPAVVLSDRFWSARFGRDRSVIGRRIRLDGQPYEVIGVMPPKFRFPTREAEIWTAMRFVPADFSDRANTYLHAIARLKPETTPDQAQAMMTRIAADLERDYPAENANVSASVIPLRDELPSQSRLLLRALVAASLGLLLIACANVSNMLLVRGLGRRKEIGVRAALGAGRRRLLRQMLTESLLLASAGGAFGCLLTIVVSPLVAPLVPAALPIAETPPIDLRMLGVALIVTLVTGLGFGLLPVVRSSRREFSPADLADGARAGVGRHTHRLRAAFVVVSVALSVALLVSTGLLLRALWRVQEVSPGFQTSGALTLRTSLAMPKYEERARRDDFYRNVLDRVRLIPGVTHAAYISFLPMVLRGGIWKVDVPGQPHRRGEEPTVSLRFVTPGLFEAMGIPVRAGRDITAADTARSTLVAVVSEAFVRRHWPGTLAIGRHFRLAGEDRTIVGIVGDIRVRGLERSSEPQVYLPYQQHGATVSEWYAPKDLVIRVARGAPEAVLPEVRRAIGSVDPAQPIADVRTLSDIVDGETATRSLQLRVLAGFAALACLLAGFGIHGVLSYSVTTQAREIGVRLALGAQRREVVSLVILQAARLTTIGLAIGAVLAVFAGRALQAMLAGLSAADPATFSSGMALVLVMTLIGTIGSACRAARIDPARALRLD